MSLSYEAVAFDPARPEATPEVTLWSRSGLSQPRDTSWGFIHHDNGRRHVRAGDWIVRFADGRVQAMTAEEYRAFSAVSGGTVEARVHAPLPVRELARLIRGVNRDNGWGADWTQDGDRLPGYLALIHSEITEAWTATSDEDAVRELGDVVVRALDLSELIAPGRVGLGFKEGNATLDEFAAPRLWAWPAALMELHTLASKALERYRKDADWREPVLMHLSVLVCDACGIMGARGVRSPDGVVREIVEKNRTRGYRHGGRRT